MKANQDDRKNNVAKIKMDMDLTRHNMEAAYDMFGKSQNPTTNSKLRAENKRREEALEGMRNGIKDETKNKDKT